MKNVILGLILISNFVLGQTRTITTNTIVTSGTYSKYSGTSTVVNALLKDSSGVITAGSANILARNIWRITGNSGTIDVTNFIGTIDSVNLSFRANNKQCGFIDLKWNNSYWGYKAGYMRTIGSNPADGGNVGIGTGALYNSYKGGDKIGIGYHAVYTDSLTYGCIGIGSFALTNSIAGNNVGIGSNALKINTTGTYNVAIGTDDMGKNTTGSHNQSLGVNSLQENTTGSFNFSAGTEALQANTTGISNVAIGYRTLYTYNNCIYDIAIGEQALKFCTDVNCVGIGAFAGSATTSGTNNIFIGTNAGLTNTTGDNNMALGVNADVVSGNLSNASAIGYLATVSASNCMVLGSGANIGIGTTAPTKKLQVVGDVGIDAVQTTVNNSTSGTSVFSEPLTGLSYKKVVIYLAAAIGTATYTFPIAFSHTPAIVTTDQVVTGVATSISTTAVTITGANTTGILILEGF